MFSKLGDIDKDENWKKLKEGREFATELRYQNSWGWMISAYIPLLDEKGNEYGYLAIDFPAESVKKEINGIILKLSFTAIIIIVIIIGFVASIIIRV